MNVQSASTSSTNDFARCQHRTPSGRRCQSTASAPSASLCYTHAQSQQNAKEVGDLSGALLQNYQNFQTAQGVNFALANIYRLLAANRISPRRASVLAYINSLLLRTLPAIDADFENGITDPTAPKKNETESASSLATEEEACTTTAPPSSPSYKCRTGLARLQRTRPHEETLMTPATPKVASPVGARHAVPVLVLTFRPSTVDCQLSSAPCALTPPLHQHRIAPQFKSNVDRNFKEESMQ